MAKLSRIRMPSPRGWFRLPLPSSVRGRIITGFGLLVLILAIVVAGSAWLAREHRSDMAEMERHTVTASLIRQAEVDVTLAKILLEHYIIDEDDAIVPVIRSSVATAVDGLAEALAREKMRGDEEEIAEIEQIAAGAAFLSEVTERVISLQQSDDVQGATTTLEGALPQIALLGRSLDEAAEFERQEVAALRSRMNSTGDLAFWLLIVSGAIGGILGVAASVFVARSILIPLSSLESAALAVAGGDLEARAPVSGPRELAHLGASLNRMTESLLDASRRRELEADRERAFAQLRESEAKFRGLLESAPDACVIVNTDGRIVLVNFQTEKMFGYKRDELIGEPVETLMPERFRKAHVGHRARYSSERSTRPVGTSQELAGQRKDGSEFPVDISLSSMETEDGVLVTSIIRDVSERKRAEEALRASDERYRTLVESTFEGITITRAGKILEANESFARMFGYELPEVIGQSPVEMTTPESAELISKNIQSGFEKPYEITGIKKDGATICIEVIGKNCVYQGHEARITAFRDITERKRAEEALRDSEGRYRALVETSPDVIYTISPNGTLTSLNSAFETLTGWSCDEWIGKNFAPVIHPDDRPLAVDQIQRLLRQEEIPPTTELRVVTKSGKHLIGEFASTLQMQKGRVVGVLGIVRDITERKQAEEELQRLNRELEKEQQEIEKLNRSLEGRVKERTQKLRLATQEMQQRNQQLLDARAQAATDWLTGLRNHRTFQEKVRDEVSQAQANGTSLGLIMLDIDGFKQVNDSLGHQAGDDILRLLAQALTGVVRWQDAYRYGGDEFAVLLPGSDGPKATRIAERLRRAVAKRTDGNGAKVTVSLGIADFPHTVDSADQLIYGADAAMYWAKSAGKNRVCDWNKLLKGRTEGSLPWYAADRGVKAPDVVAALVAALAAKDPVTAAHTQRCSWYTAKLAEELGLGEEETSVIRLASLLHDIGKLAVPDEVLLKPGPLNEDEWAIMKQHPAAALHVLGHIRSIADATPAILHHHEHFDGSGYPDGLAGEDIPLASRILLVTDAFDAMTTDRPYRKAMPVEAAIEELERNSGSQFDSTIVEAFLRILARDGAQPLPSLRPAATKTAATVRTG